MSRTPLRMPQKPSNEPVLCFARAEQWNAWLEQNHKASAGAGVFLGKSDDGASLLSYSEALEVALCWGWTDGQKYAGDSDSWVQRFVPQSGASAWTKLNRGKAEALIASGSMKPAGLLEVEKARTDGRWSAAPEPAKSAASRRASRSSS